MRPTPIRPDMEQHPLAIAAREINAYAEKHGIAETAEKHGIKIEDLRYMAEQRSLRCIYAFKRGINLNLKEHEILPLSRAEALLHIEYTSLYMDGILIGYRARQIEDENK